MLSSPPASLLSSKVDQDEKTKLMGKLSFLLRDYSWWCVPTWRLGSGGNYI